MTPPLGAAQRRSRKAWGTTLRRRAAPAARMTPPLGAAQRRSRKAWGTTSVRHNPDYFSDSDCFPSIRGENPRCDWGNARTRIQVNEGGFMKFRASQFISAFCFSLALAQTGQRHHRQLRPGFRASIRRLGRLLRRERRLRLSLLGCAVNVDRIPHGGPLRRRRRRHPRASTSSRAREPITTR
jgi:hypothetical protein